MKLTEGKLILILIILYIIFSTPWYIPKVVKPMILGIPLWAFITIVVLLALGYGLIYLFTTMLERVQRSGG